MSVRPHPSRKGSWYIDLGYGKNRERIPFEGTEVEAREYEAERKMLKRPVKTSCFELTTTLIDRYLEFYKTDHQASGYEKQTRCCKFLKQFFGKYLLQNITPQLVEDYKTKRLETGVTRSTIQKELCALSGLFKWAVDDVEILTEAPCRIKKFRTKSIKAPIPDVPMADEVSRIIAEIPANKRGLFKLMFNMGLRKSEAFNIRAEDVNLEREILTVMGKGNKQRVVPLVGDDIIAELKERIEKQKTGYLWVSPFTDGPYQDIRGCLKEAAKRAGVQGRVYNHLLRHAAGTDLLEFSDLRTVQVLLGHSTSKTTELYTHIRQDRLRSAMKKRQENQ
jgi:site-specific recombinase XerD